MQNFKRHTLSAVMAASLAAVALGACNRADDRTVGRDTTPAPATTATATAGQAVDNAALTTRVKSALLADDQVKGTQINVDSSNGVVTLTGTVDKPEQINRAVELARKVDGVQRVENNLAASPTAEPGIVPGTQPPGTAPAVASDRQPGKLDTTQPGVMAPPPPQQPGTTNTAPGK